MVCGKHRPSCTRQETSQISRVPAVFRRGSFFLKLGHNTYLGRQASQNRGYRGALSEQVSMTAVLESMPVRSRAERDRHAHSGWLRAKYRQ